MSEPAAADAGYLQPTRRSRLLACLLIGFFGSGFLIGNLFFPVVPLEEIDPALDAVTRLAIFQSSLFRSLIYNTGLSISMSLGVLWYGMRVLRSRQYPAPDGPLLWASRITPIRKPWKVVLTMTGFSALLLLHLVSTWHYYYLLFPPNPRCGPECAECRIAPAPADLSTASSRPGNDSCVRSLF